MPGVLLPGRSLPRLSPRCTDVAQPSVLTVRLVWADPSGDKGEGPGHTPGPAGAASCKVQEE